MSTKDPKRFLSLIPALVMCVALVGCADPEPDGLVIGTYALDESRALAEVVRRTLISDGVEVLVDSEFTDRAALMAALDSGRVDLAVDYLASLLDHYGHASTRNHALQLEHLDASRPGLLVAEAPAHGGRGLAVQSGFAAAEGLRSVAALEPFAHDLVIGGPPDCLISPTCIQGLTGVYGFEFAEFRPFDTELRIEAALADGVVDVAVLFITDPVVIEQGFVVLEDDLQMNGSERPIVLAIAGALTPSTIERLQEAFDQIDTSVLRGLRYRTGRIGVVEAVAEFLGVVGTSD